MKAAMILLALVFGGGVALLLAQPSGEVCLAEFVTSLEGRTPDQRHNATLAMSKLEEVVIRPGETISFNQTVGAYTVDAGYRKAPVSYNGQLLDGFGGGVCQTSTTVYNAALMAGLEIIQRSRHRYAPLYAPPGRDAAVAYPQIDFKFRNPYAIPVRLRGRWVGGRLIASFYADRRPGPPCRLITEVQDVEAPRTVVLNRERATARTRNTGKAGFEVVTYRDWGHRREFVSRDSYPAMHRVVQYSSD